MSNDDRYFNLQLTIQKLEEELSLYRNGATEESVLDLIKEKNDELNASKAELAKATEDFNSLHKKYKMIFHASQTTVANCESLEKQLSLTQAELKKEISQHAEAAAALATKTETLCLTEENLKTVTQELAVATQQCEEQANVIQKMQDQALANLTALNSQKLKRADLETENKILTVHLKFIYWPHLHNFLIITALIIYFIYSYTGKTNQCGN